MTKNTFQGKSPDELKQALYESRKTLREYRFGAAGASAGKVKEAREAKKNIARIMTTLNRHA